jgi:DnaA family protein
MKSSVSMKQLTLDVGQAPLPRLANFVAGPNAEALQHLELWAKAGTRSSLPIYIWGPNGTGKSHLMTGVQQCLIEQGQLYGSITAQDHEPAAFDERWAAVFLDDVHIYSEVQQHAAFVWLVQAQAHQTGVLACGLLPPADLKLRDDLRSRFGWGHVWALRLMGDDERRTVLHNAAHERGLHLNPDVMDFILVRFSRDLSHLMQLLDHLDRFALQTQRSISIPMIKDMLQVT